MDAHRFDLLARTLSITGSRRVALVVAGGGLGALLGFAGITVGDSKKKKRKKKKKKKKLRCNKLAMEIPCLVFGGSCCEGALGEICTTCGCCPAAHTLCCLTTNNRHTCCPSDFSCCWGATEGGTCCPPDTTCCRKNDGTLGLNACCIAGTTCCNGVCCPTTAYACNGDRCCSTLPGPQVCLPDAGSLPAA